MRAALVAIILSLAAAPAATAAVPSNSSPPALTGSAVVGATVTTTAGTWAGSPTGYEYAWWHCMPISGSPGCTPAKVATGESYVIAATDLGGTVYSAVRAQNASGWSSWVTSSSSLGPIAAAGVPASTTAPRIVGAPVVGQSLTADPGTWTESPDEYGYEWWRAVPNGSGGYQLTLIAGATAAVYAVTANDLGTYLRARVRAHGPGGWSSFLATSLLGPVAAQGSPSDPGQFPGDEAGDEVGLGDDEAAGGDAGDTGGEGVTGSTQKQPAVRLAGKVTQVRSGSRILVRPGLAVTCPVRCRYTLLASAPARRGARKGPPWATIGTVSRLLGRGATATPAFLVNARGRALLRKARRLPVRVRITVIDDAEQDAQLQRQITVRG